MKAIEPGCMAIIIGGWPENIGKCVQVLSYIGDLPNHFSDSHWEIDTPILTRACDDYTYNSPIPNSEHYVYYEEESCLMRIDGDPEDIIETVDKKKVEA